MPFTLPDPWIPDASVQRNFDALKAEVGRLDTPILRVASLPSSPSDGQEIYYTADATNGIVWHLKYNAGSASAYKWEFVGGSPLVSESDGSVSTTSTTYTGIDGTTPTVVLPLAGDYLITISLQTYHSAAGAWTATTVKLGAAAASDNECVFFYSPVASAQGAPSRQMVRTGLAAAASLAMNYRNAVGTGNYLQRVLSVQPLRVG